MKSFKQFVKEETMPYAGTKSGVIDIRDSSVRDGLNQQLAGVTSGKYVTPYIAFERVCKALANFHIFPPRTNYFEGDSGAVNFRIDQFGSKIGMTNDGAVVANPETPYHLYFEYRQSDCGMFMIFCEVVDQDELEEIMDDLEAELNDETVEDDREDKLDLDEEMQPALPETGSKMTPGSNQQVITTGVTIPDELEGKNRDKMKSKLEKKSIEEDNIPYIADPESSSTAQYKPAAKLAEEQINEISKKTLSSYIKKASHDVATKSAAVGRYAERANKEEDNRKKNNDYSGYRQGRKDSEFADKMFDKSWNRRKGIAKAVDKMAKEEVEQVDEVSAGLVGKVNKARLEKPAKTEKADETRGKAVKKAWLASKVGEMKEQNLQELSDKLKKRYVKKAEDDKKAAEREANFSDREAADTGRSKESRKAFKKEAEWLKGIAAKRAKGIDMAKKKV
jgi:hypothetical protein